MSRAYSIFAGLALLAALGTSFGASAGTTPFTTPAEFETDVAFWVRIYSKLESSAGLVHDAEALDVVYERTPDLPPESSDARRSVVEARTQFYRERLLRLAGPGVPAIDAEDRRILKLWEGRATSRELRRAADNVRFQSGQAEKFRAGLQRAGAWRPQIERMLAAAHMPAELAALPHVESSFDLNAYSKAGAAGLWQLMRSTGRRYIRVDDQVDERFDPFASTSAAIEYFRDAHQRLESWPLTVVAYNHGVNGMVRARTQLGTTNIVRVLREYRAPSFKFASRNFYPSFLAALEVERKAEQFFGALTVEAPWQTCSAPVLADVGIGQVSAATGHSADLLRAMNPALRAAVWEGAAAVPAGYALRLPAQAVDSGFAVGWLSSDAWRAEHVGVESFYVVQPGDTLIRIGAGLGVPPREIAALNKLTRPDVILAGQRLRVMGTDACDGACTCPGGGQPVQTVAAAASADTAADD